MSGGSRVNPKKPGKGIPIDMSFAFHTDAGTTPNDSIIGTLAIYTLISEGSRKYPDGEDRILGRLLADNVQSQIVSDVRAQYDPKWSRRQLSDRSYSESRTGDVPALLLELLSHQNFADMKYGLDPGFRFTVSRAIYKGILKFMSSRYGYRYAVQPLPVRSFAAILDGDTAELSWKETIDTLEHTAVPEGFVLYTRTDNGGFDNGVILNNVRKSGDRYCIDIPVRKGHLYDFKVVAFNAGGRSFPSEILSVGIPETEKGKTVLVVNNFDRVGPPAWFDTQTYAGFDSRLDGGVAYGKEINFIGEMYQCRRELPWLDDDNPGFGASYTDQAGKLVWGNSFDYPSRHGKALMAAGYSFCSASAEAFESCNLDSFWVTDIICGKQISTPAGTGNVNAARFQVLPESLRKAITACTSRGGNILMSGANIGTDLCDNIYPMVADSAYRADSQKFAKDILGYKWLTNYASRAGKVQNLGERKETISFYQKQNDYIYQVETPDGLMPASDKASIFLRYTDTDIPAGICNEGKGYRTVCLGFPIETITETSEMETLFRMAFDFFYQGERN